MSNEDPNKTPGWRNKLDELEHLPGSAFNVDAAWDNLDARLRGNKKSKQIYWYWMAAACLVVGLMITAFNYFRSPAQRSNKETAIKQPKEIKQPDLKTDVNKNKNENENAIESVKDKIVKVSNKPVLEKGRITLSEVATKVQSRDVLINYPEEQPVAKALEIVNNKSTTAVIPPKKKLNVVHINELGDPVIESSDITRIEDIHSFKLKFGNGEVLSNSPVVSRPSGLIILKTKTASN